MLLAMVKAESLADFCRCLLTSAFADAQRRAAGITAAPTVARAYDLILDANFDELKKTLPATCPPAPMVACRGLEALSLWWQIQLDLDNRSLDAAFLPPRIGQSPKPSDGRRPNRNAPRRGFISAPPTACARSSASTASSGSRRPVTASASRNRSRQALALDPSMHDAEFGIGMYRYYAGVAPAIFKFLRFLLLLPGGDREGGLAQLERAASARRAGARRSAVPDPGAVSLVRTQIERSARDRFANCRQRYPHNPLFRQIEAEILDKHFHDHAASLKASEQLLALAQSRRGVSIRHRRTRRARATSRSRRAALQQRKRESRRYRSCDHVPTRVDEDVAEAIDRGAFADYNKRFVLDNRFFSSIIYIWYEGGRLRPLVVKR